MVRPMVVRPQKHTVMTNSTQPVFLPDNEPYLGRELLKLFDEAIVKSMAVHRKPGARAYATDLKPLQIAAIEIIPQGISIALEYEGVNQAGIFVFGWHPHAPTC